MMHACESYCYGHGNRSLTRCLWCTNARVLGGGGVIVKHQKQGMHEPHSLAHSLAQSLPSGEMYRRSLHSLTSVSHAQQVF